MWGGLFLLVVYWVGRRYWGRAAGLAAVVMLAVSNPFLVATHTLRPDIQVVTMIFGALLLAERSADPERRRPACWPFWPVCCWRWSWTRTRMGRRSSRWWPLSTRCARAGALSFGAARSGCSPAGMVAAGAYYLSVRFLRTRRIHRRAGLLGGCRQGIACRQSHRCRTGGLAAKLTTMVVNEWLRYHDYFGEEPLELLVILVGLVGGVWMAVRGSHPARLMLVPGLVFACAFFVVAVSTKSKYYMLLTYPYYLLLLAATLRSVAAWLAVRTARPPLAQPLGVRAAGCRHSRHRGRTAETRRAGLGQLHPGTPLSRGAGVPATDGPPQ